MRPTLSAFSTRSTFFTLGAALLASAAIGLSRPALALEAPVLTDPGPAGNDETLSEPISGVPVEPWGIHNGNTAGAGANLIYAEMGWPDMTVGWHHGATRDVDVGLRVSAIYGGNYTTTSRFGMGVTIPLRFALARSAGVSLLFHVDPGIKFDAFNPSVFVGPQIPFGIELGMHVTPRFTVALGADVPLLFDLKPDVTEVVPVLFGASVEGHVSDRVALFLNTRGGIVWGHNLTGVQTNTGLLVQGGFAFRR